VRTVEPYKVPLVQILCLKGGLQLWLMQVKHTRKHLKMERERGFRMVNLSNGHFIGCRPWCDTQLYACPDGLRACCACQHGESFETAMEAIDG